jgi:hypothetical protein
LLFYGYLGGQLAQMKKIEKYFQETIKQTNMQLIDPNNNGQLCLWVVMKAVRDSLMKG